jgi:cysteine-rich repeat protein
LGKTVEGVTNMGRRILLLAALAALASGGSACDDTQPVDPPPDAWTDRSSPPVDTETERRADLPGPDGPPASLDAEVPPPDLPLGDLTSTCGDVHTDPGEDCDDGKNGNPLDGCRDDCTYTCSDPGEDCDDVIGDCGVPICEAGGVGQVCGVVPADDPPPGSDGNPCTAVVCAQGVPAVQGLPDGIPCDNAGGVPGDYCVETVCVDPVCGDAVTGPLEDCDDGNDEDGDGCSALCVAEDLPPCPADMVLIPAAPERGVPATFCMDRYEASRPDATATSMGGIVSTAQSKPGVLPWWEEDVDAAQVLGFEAACAAAGKRLCAAQEWGLSCGGTTGNTYAFGMAFDKEVCNSVDTWCESWCLEHDIDPVVDGAGCGQTLFSAYPGNGAPYHPVPTGYMTACMNEYGAYDLGGNVWEVVQDDPGRSPRGWPFQIRGGAFDSGTPSLRFQCSFEANWTNLVAGFRCCKDVD